MALSLDTTACQRNQNNHRQCLFLHHYSNKTSFNKETNFKQKNSLFYRCLHTLTDSPNARLAVNVIELEIQ